MATTTETEFCCLCWDIEATLELTDNDGDRLVFCQACYDRENQAAAKDGRSLISASEIQ